MTDTTTARRQKNRRAKLDAAAAGAGWHSWAEYERHIINGAIEMQNKSAAKKLPPLTLRERAAARVDGSPALAAHREFIMADWREGAEHWRWVISAPVAEIVEWAEAGQ